MQTTPIEKRAGADVAPGEDAERRLPVQVRALLRVARDDQFNAMRAGFRRSGGLARGHEVAGILACRSGLSLGTLARWIVDGDVVHLDWQRDTWLPMFQFGGTDSAPREGTRQVLKELRGVMDPWDIAQWFARPCAGLDGRTPADSMAVDPVSVLHAARCDRYVVDA